MRVLLSLGSFHPAHGGPFFSVGNLARALAVSGQTIQFLTADYPHLPVQPAPDGVDVHAIQAWLIPGIRQSCIPGCAKWLDQQIESFRPDVIHDNGLWLTLNNQVAAAAHRHCIPLVLSPRGCLDPWAYQYRRWKKDLAMALYQRRDLESVRCFHAASELEADNIRKMGFRQPIAVIPNGIEVRGQRVEVGTACGVGEGDLGLGIADSGIGKGDLGDGENLTSDLRPLTSPPRSGTRYALFLGRLHPIKNLPALVKAWALVKPEGWRLKIAGSDEVGHRAELEALVRELGLAGRVEFLGPVHGDAKWELIRGASLAFLVSHSENFGISAAEALGCGVPVIASRSTPWACLESERMGWWVDKDPESLASAIRAFLLLPGEEREVLRRRAKSYAAAHFGWMAIAEKFTTLYAWLQGQQPQPDFVKT